MNYQLTFTTNNISQDTVIVEAFCDNQKCASATLMLEEDKFFLQKISVVAEFRNKGIGSQLLRACEEVAQDSHIGVIYAEAQESYGRSVVNFYTKNEYFCGEEEFVKNGLPHKIVWKVFN